MIENRTLDMYMRRQYTIRINAESRDFWRGQDLTHDVANSVQDVHELVNKNEQFM